MSTTSGYQGEVLGPDNNQGVVELRTAKPTTVTAPREKKVAPSDALIPRKGKPAWRYRFNRMVGRPDLVPELGVEDEIEYLIARLRFLAHLFVSYDMRVKLTAVFSNTKGGGSKSTTATYVASVIGYYTQVSVGLMPCTSSTTTSTTAAIIGAPDNTMTLRQFKAEALATAQRRKDGNVHVEIGPWDEVSHHLPATRFGVRVISEDTGARNKGQDKLSLQDYFQIALSMIRTYDVVMLDAGNDDIEENNFGFEAMRRTEVNVFTATASNRQTMLMMGNTIGDFIDLLEGDKKAQVARTAIAVFSKVKRDKQPEFYEKYARRRLDRKGRDVGPSGFDGKLMTVPYDEYIGPANEDEDTKISITDPRKLAKPTLLAYLRLAVAIYERRLLKDELEVVFDSYTDEDEDRFAFRVIPAQSSSDTSERK